MTGRKVKVMVQEEEEDGEDLDADRRCTKAKRHEISEPMVADADLKLAEKLDKVLKISGPTNHPKFLTNRPHKNSKSKPEKSNIKLLSTAESIELAKEQAKKQIERQLQINSVAGNQVAHKTGLKSFKFNDGYELNPKAGNREIKYKTTLDEGEITLVLTKKSTDNTQAETSKKRVQFAEEVEDESS